MKIHILKITDRDDEKSDPMYYTIKGLRDRVLKDWFEVWETMPIDEMRENLETDDEYMIDWLSGWGYDVEVILTITENDIPKRSDVIEVDISFYHPDNDETIKVYDEEGMREEFEYKLDCTIKNSGL